MKLSELVLLMIIPSFGYGQSKILGEEHTYCYSAEYSDPVNNILIVDTIQFIVTKIPWKTEPGVQQTVIWQYPKSTVTNQVNDHISSIGWLPVDSTGAIENEKKYWIHPPRHNQYSITEVAPFPTVQFPCEINKTFNNITYIGTGWGKWDNLKLRNKYQFINKETKYVGASGFECWIIASESESELGRSDLTTAFNEEVGFVEFSYRFFNKTEIRIILTRIE
jgi:hypothetical protein